MVENNKTIITLEEGEEITIGDVTLTAGMSFEVQEAKKEADDDKDDDKKADDKDAEKKSDDDDEKMDEKKKESVIYTVEADVKIGDVILEKGDRFEIVEDEKVEETTKEVIEEAEAPDSSKDGEKAKDDEMDDGKKAKDAEKDKGAKAKDDEKDKGKKAKDDEKDSDAKEKEKEEAVVYTVEEDIEIPGTDVVLEKGDKFTVL